MNPGDVVRKKGQPRQYRLDELYGRSKVGGGHVTVARMRPLGESWVKSVEAPVADLEVVRPEPEPEPERPDREDCESSRPGLERPA